MTHRKRLKEIQICIHTAADPKSIFNHTSLFMCYRHLNDRSRPNRIKVYSLCIKKYLNTCIVTLIIFRQDVATTHLKMYLTLNHSFRRFQQWNKSLWRETLTPFIFCLVTPLLSWSQGLLSPLWRTSASIAGKSRAVKIIKDSNHPGNRLFILLPSGKRFRSMMAKTERLRGELFPSGHQAPKLSPITSLFNNQ